MNIKTVVFGLFVCVLAGVAYWDFLQSDRRDQKEHKQQTLFQGWSEEAVQSLSIVNPRNQIQLEKYESRWQMLQPLKVRADHEMTEDFLATLFKEQVVKVSSGDAIDWKQYGLDTSDFKIILKNQQTKKELLIANESTFDGKIYIRELGSHRLYLGEPMWKRLVDKKASDLRDKLLLPPGTDLLAVEITSKKNRVSITKEPDSWQVQGLQIQQTDIAAIKSFIEDEILFLKALDFASDSPKGLKKYNFQQPNLTVKLITKKLGEVSWQLIQQGDVYYLKSSQGDSVYKIGSVDFNDLMIGKNKFRKKAFPVEFKLSKASKLKIVIDDEVLELVKNEAGWRAIGRESEKLNIENLANLFSALQSMRTDDFSGNKNLKPSHGVQIFDKNNKIQFELMWSTKLIEDKYIQAKSNFFEDSLLIERFRIEALKLSTLFEESSSKEKKDK